jgi:hypothetical protein
VWVKLRLRPLMGVCRGRADEALRADHLASPSWPPSREAVTKGNIRIVYAAENH